MSGTPLMHSYQYNGTRASLEAVPGSNYIISITANSRGGTSSETVEKKISTSTVLLGFQ